MSKFMRLRAGAALLLTILLLVACGGGAQPAPAATTAPATQATTAPSTSGGEAEPTAEESTEENTTAGETPVAEATGTTESEDDGADSGSDEQAEIGSATALNLFEVAEEIDSYRVRTQVEVSGEAFEDEAQQSFNITGEFVREPKAQRIVLSSGTSTTDTIEAIVIGEQQWIKFGDQWSAVSDAEQAPDLSQGFGIVNFAALQQQTDQLEEVGTEEVNGFTTTHYRLKKDAIIALLDEEATDEDRESLEIAEGDIYVAPEGFVVRSVMHMEGEGISDDKPDARGAMDITYEIFDVNETIEISEPELPGVEELLGYEFPLPEGATQSMAIQGFATYSVPDQTVEEVATFYEEELTGAGFEADDTLKQVSEESALLSFKGNDLDVTITIQAGENGSSEVTIASTKQGE